MNKPWWYYFLCIWIPMSLCLSIFLFFGSVCMLSKENTWGLLLLFGSVLLYWQGVAIIKLWTFFSDALLEIHDRETNKKS
jgi:hypothetical protein